MKLILCSLLLAISLHHAYGSITYTCNRNKTTLIYLNNEVCVPSTNVNITQRNTKMIFVSPKLLTHGIKIESQTVLYFPTFDTQFHTMQVIIVKNSHLKEITPSNLQNFTSLKYLQLSGNDLTSIESKTFIANTNLEFLDLSDNEIVHFHENSFDGLSNLMFLNMLQNFCISVNKSGIDDVNKLAEYAIEKCGNKEEERKGSELIVRLKKWITGIQARERKIYLGVFVVFIIIMLWICCFCCCCCRKKKRKNDHQNHAPDQIDNERSTVAQQNAYTRPPENNNGRHSVPTIGSNKGTERLRKISTPNSPMIGTLRTAPNPPSIVPSSNISSLSPKIQELNARQSHDDTYENVNNMTQSKSSIDDDGYMQMNQVKPRFKVEPQGTLKRTSNEANNTYMPMNQVKTSVETNHYLPMNRSKAVTQPISTPQEIDIDSCIPIIKSNPPKFLRLNSLENSIRDSQIQIEDFPPPIYDRVRSVNELSAKGSIKKPKIADKPQMGVSSLNPIYNRIDSINNEYIVMRNPQVAPPIYDRVKSFKPNAPKDKIDGPPIYDQVNDDEGYLTIGECSNGRNLIQTERESDFYYTINSPMEKVDYAEITIGDGNYMIMSGKKKEEKKTNYANVRIN